MAKREKIIGAHAEVDLKPPEYAIIEKLYESKKTIILRAVHKQDGLPVILKASNPDAVSLEDIIAFKNEFKRMSEMKATDAIPKAYGLLKCNRSWMIVLEDIEAVSLEDYLQAKPLTLDEFFFLAPKIVSALEVLHGQELIHKDINPANIIYNSQTRKLQIIDLGLSEKILSARSHAVASDSLQGTLPYISPEQTGRIKQTVDYRSDLYSLGITFFQMLTGRLPFESDDPLGMIFNHLTTTPPDPRQFNAAIPEVLAQIILKLMEKKPDSRYQSAHGLLADLRSALLSFNAKGDVDHFALGSLDTINQFKIPTKLYGREKEVELLLSNYRATQHDTFQISIVAGPAGIGKSSLISEIYEPIILQGGYFITGQFDQFERCLPCLALSRMLNSFVQQVLTESKEQIENWKKTILKSVDQNGQILINLAPEMEKIIGKQPLLPIVDARASENRFLYVIKNFIQNLGTKEHPFVIFWDDVQWADSISIKLLESWFTQISSGYLFLIIAYRDNEVNITHPLKIILDKLNPYDLQYINVAPLKQSALMELYVDTLRTDASELKDFAQVCYAKTAGSPFFLKQFLQDLYDNDLIFFDRPKGRWAFNLPAINSRQLANNLLEMVVMRLGELNPHLQNILIHAACIGNIFDLNLMAYLLEEAPHKVAEGLDYLANDNYILALPHEINAASNKSAATKIAYKFSHDKIREAAFLFGNKEKINAIHLKIGRYLVATTPHAELDSQVINIVDHMDKGIEFIDPKERFELVENNLKAGSLAKLSQAHKQALYYFEMAESLIKEEDWENHYDKVLDLYNEIADVSAILKLDTQLEKYFDVITKHVKKPLDKVKIVRIKIFSQVINSLDNEAIATGLAFLKELNVHLPANPNFFNLLVVIMKCRIATGKVSIEKIPELPLMTDEKNKAILLIMNEIINPCIKVRTKLSLIIMCESLLLTLKYGVSPTFSPYCCLGYSVVSLGVSKNFDRAFKLADLSVALLDKYDDKKCYPQVINGLTYYINHARWHYQSDLFKHEKTYFTALDVGNYEMALLSLMLRDGMEVLAGVPLDVVDKHLQQTSLFMKQYNYQFEMASYHNIRLQAVSNLLGKSENTFKIIGAYYNEDKQLAMFKENNNVLGIVIYYIYKMLLALLFDQQIAAADAAFEIKPYIKKLVTDMYYPNYLYLLTLIEVRNYDTYSTVKRFKARRLIKKCIQQIKVWAKRVPKNYLHKYYFLKAEESRILRKYKAATFYYDKAIELANINEFLQDEAMAKEACAKFYEANGHLKISKLYLLEAYNTYLKWGAKAKVQQLEEKYVWLKKFENQQNSLGNVLSMITSTSGVHNEVLDYASVIKASSVISNEIFLPSLIARLLEILVENMGAERSMLLLKTNDKLCIEGEFNKQLGIINLLQSIPLETQKSDLPFSIVQYVDHTNETIVLEDASKTRQFMRDNYVLHRSPKSILCAPIHYQGKFIGIFYFENNLTTGAFLAERLQFLKLLTSQIAISIENARLCYSFEKFVPKQFLELLGKDNPVDVKLGDGIQKNLTTLFTDIRDFTTLTEKHNATYVFNLLNQFLSVIEPIIAKNNGFIDKFVGDAIMALFPREANDAVLAAVEIHQAIKRFNKKHENLFLGIGISSGLCMLGTLGSKNRMDGTVISDVVNTASRIETLNKFYGTQLLISGETKNQLKNVSKFNLRYVDNVVLKGKSVSSTIWEVLDPLPLAMRTDRINNLPLYEQGIALYQDKKYHEAKAIFLQCLKTDPTDSVSKMYATLCEERETVKE